jgi:hypothetical protein
LRFTIPLTSQQHQEKLRVKKLRKWSKISKQQKISLEPSYIKYQKTETWWKFAFFINYSCCNELSRSWVALKFLLTIYSNLWNKISPQNDANALVQ